MKTKNLIFVIGIATLLSSCASSYYLRPTEQTKNMDMIFKDGIPVSVSYIPNSTVTLYGIKNTNNELWLHVFYRNDDSTYRVNVFPENITVSGQSSYGEQATFKVFAASEYLKKMRGAQAWAMAAQAFSASVQAQQAGYSQSMTNSSAYGSAYGSNGTYVTGSAYGNSTTTTYNASKVSEANARNQQQLNQSAQMYSDAYNATEEGLIKTVTLFPKQHVQGNVVVKFKGSHSQKIFISVPIGNEIHKFTFTK